MIGGYFGLLSYCDIDANELTQQDILDKIEFYTYHANNRAYDLIDYEWLVCMEVKNRDNEEIMSKINGLKDLIAKNYLLKEKLKARLSLVRL